VPTKQRSLKGRRLPCLVALVAAIGLMGSARGGLGQTTAAQDRRPGAARRPTTEDQHRQAFDREVRALAGRLDLPDLVVVVARDGEIIHRVEWGYADLEAKSPVTVDHVFWLASVTKTFTATLIMQMADESLINLDDHMIDYWLPSFFPVRITPEYRLRHDLGHTAQWTPGRTFVYNGGRFGFVSGVFEKVGGMPLKERLIQRILTPLKMDSTMPGIGDRRYQHLRDRLVTPYRYDEQRRRHAEAPEVLQMGDLYASSGMASSAADLVRYAHALDGGRLLSPEAHAAMTRPAVSTDGDTLPYAVGWFVQDFGGETLVWHYGYGAADSALLVRVPRRKLTLVALANSDRLSASAPLGDGNVLCSPVAVAFVKHFVAPRSADLACPDFDAPTEVVTRHLDERHAAGAAPIDDEEVLAQAFLRHHIGGDDAEDGSKAEGLLRWLLRESPGVLRRPDVAVLTLLCQQTDPTLLAAAKPVLDALLKRKPEHPGVLAAVEYSRKAGDERRVLDAQRRFADLRGYEDDSRKQEAALQVGLGLAEDDPGRAVTYLWNAMTWWYNSGNGGDLGARITRALDELRKRRASP
jgi:CubicO group peptidase (beta-lactamase class C family)